MYLLAIGSLLAILLVIGAVKLRKTPRRQKRWMPDIHRVA
jgi:hypothetical protein